MASVCIDSSCFVFQQRTLTEQYILCVSKRITDSHPLKKAIVTTALFTKITNTKECYSASIQF